MSGGYSDLRVEVAPLVSWPVGIPDAGLLALGGTHAAHLVVAFRGEII